jgi:DNA-binding response OmpR family regulator
MRRRVLIIDDEPGFRETLSEVLRTAGYEVETSAFLASCVGAGLSGRFDLVTLDLRMPEVEGLEVARLLRKLAPRTSVLVISGYLNGPTRTRLRGLGVEHTLAKPAGVSDLLRAVEIALRPPPGRPEPSRSPGRALAAPRAD